MVRKRWNACLWENIEVRYFHHPIQTRGDDDAMKQMGLLFLKRDLSKHEEQWHDFIRDKLTPAIEVSCLWFISREDDCPCLMLPTPNSPYPFRSYKALFPEGGHTNCQVAKPPSEASFSISKGLRVIGVTHGKWRKNGQKCLHTWIHGQC